MTHKELLELLTPTITYSPWARIKNPNKVMKALRAVVELHKSDGHFCVECSHDIDYLFNYPCNTIQAIEKAFK